MDRRLLLSALLPTLLLSCSVLDGDTAPSGPDSPISFAVANTALTRGSVISGTVFPTSESFRVFAWQTDGGVTSVLMGSEPTDVESNVVSNTTGQWAPRKRYYWPDGDETTVSFYAVYPKDYSVTRSGSTYTVDFTIPSSVSDQKDMMVARSENLLLSATTGGAAPLQFSHILSQVAFKGRLAGSYTGWRVSVGSLRLCNVNSRGVYTFGTAAVTPATPAVLQDYQFPLASASVTLTDAEEAVSLSDPSGPALLMPQSLTGWDRTMETSGSATPITSGCYLAVGCTITDAEGTLAWTGNVYVPFADTWEPSLSYTYTLSFGCGYTADGTISVAYVSLESAEISDWSPKTPVTPSLEI